VNRRIIEAWIRAEIQKDKQIGSGWIEAEAIQTTDATPTTILTLEIEDNFSGILEVEILGVNDGVGAEAVTGRKIVRFKKDTALTLGTPSNILAIETDIVGATFSISNVSEDIVVTVTGAASTTINWSCKYRINQNNATNVVAP
jgi:hypothetical protein